MNRISKTFLISSLAALLVSNCGKNAPRANQFDGKDYLVVGTDHLVRESARLTGNGSIVFNAPLAEAASKNNFRVTFSLNDGGTVGLVTNSTNTLSQGVTVKFTRAAKVLKVALLANDKTTDVSERFQGVDASTDLTYQVDVHNNEEPAHIIVWDAVVTEFDEASARLDTESEKALNVPGQGKDKFWGLTLVNSTVRSAAVGKPKHDHEEGH